MMHIGSSRPLRIEPDVVKEPRVHVLPADATAKDAAELMAQTGAGAVVVLGPDGRFAGLITDQDLVREVMAKGLHADAVRLASLTTRRPECLQPSDFVLDVLDLMLVRNVRHLPVVVDEQVTAVVSIGDICAVVRQSLDAQLQACQAAVFGNLPRE